MLISDLIPFVLFMGWWSLVPKTLMNWCSGVLFMTGWMRARVLQTMSCHPQFPWLCSSRYKLLTGHIVDSSIVHSPEREVYTLTLFGANHHSDQEPCRYIEGEYVLREMAIVAQYENPIGEPIVWFQDTESNTCFWSTKPLHATYCLLFWIFLQTYMAMSVLYIVVSNHHNREK